MTTTEPYSGPERRRNHRQRQEIEEAARREVIACLRRERRKVYARAAAVLAIIASIWISSYQGRVNVVQSQRTACQRGLRDRRANAEGWRIAEHARLAEGQLAIARKYAAIAAGLEQRAAINCATAYPAPRLLEFGRTR